MRTEFRSWWHALGVVWIALSAPLPARAVSLCGAVPSGGGQCWNWFCDTTSRQWFEVFKPLGTSCSGGTCDGEGSCTSPRTGEDQFPKFIVVSIIYTPAGRQGAVSYGAGSSEGDHFQVTATTSVGVVVQSTAFGLGFSNTYSLGRLASTSVGFTKSDMYVAGMANPGTYDIPDRGNDTFVIWRNPKFTHYRGGGLPEEIAWTIDYNSNPIINVSAKQLLGQESAYGVVQEFLSGLSAAERQSILALDPAFGNGIYPATRFQKVAAFQMRGPDYVGGLIPYGTLQVSYNTSRDQTLGTFVNGVQTILAGFEFLGTGGKAGVTYSVGLQESRTSTTGEQKAASITMRTSSVCYSLDVDIYIDAAFGTYVSLPGAQYSCQSAPLATGYLTTDTGAAAANQAFVAATSTGPRIVYTDASGRYAAY